MPRRTAGHHEVCTIVATKLARARARALPRARARAMARRTLQRLECYRCGGREALSLLLPLPLLLPQNSNADADKNSPFCGTCSRHGAPAKQTKGAANARRDDYDDRSLRHARHTATILNSTSNRLVAQHARVSSSSGFLVAGMRSTRCRGCLLATAMDGITTWRVQVVCVGSFSSQGSLLRSSNAARY